MIPTERLRAAYLTARDALLAERVPEGHWVGELSTSALSTATAVMALHLVNPFEHRERIDAGLKWLTEHQNADGGWGDTVKSFSNISTTMLCRAAFKLVGEKEHPDPVQKVEEFLTLKAGVPATLRAAAIRARYGKDHTFSVPILMSCALAKLVSWDEVPRLPFELACLPQSWYRFAKLPVVSYALPALIAIGQTIHHHRRSRNPIRNAVRRLARGRALKVLRRIQPTTGGYLEATPLTSFVVMALASMRRRRSESEKQVIDEGVRFLVNSVRPDGSWPIDTNLATWVTTLGVNALVSADDLGSLDTKDKILAWLLKQQYKERHPYTGAPPGGWAWTDLAGGVPDCDDTPGAMLAASSLVLALEQEGPYAHIDAFPASPPPRWPEARAWVAGLQNRDGGYPTFCRGWGTLPFDRSGSDLTAHALRALFRTDKNDLLFKPEALDEPAIVRGLAYLAKQQRPDGSWLPLWFGNQHAPDDINPVYGTARVLAAYRDLYWLYQSPECKRGIAFLLSVQNADGGWGGAKDCPSSVEETALVVEVLLDLVDHESAGSLPSPLAGEGGGASPPGEGAPSNADLRSTPPLTASPLTRLEDSPPSPARGEGKEQIQRGVAWLVEAVESGRFREPSPIGFYFAKLWYFEKLYPLIFTVAALGCAVRVTSSAAPTAESA